MIQLQKKYQESIASITAQIASSPFEDPDFYSAWLSQCYYFVKHSTRLLALAAANAPFEHQILHRRMIKHVSEEQGHENLALKDISNLNNQSLSPELSSTRYFYQLQYSLLLRDPTSTFMGYILFLEGLAVEAGAALLKRIQDAHSEKASLFVKVHAEEDVGHIQSAFEQLGAFNESEIRKIEQNLVDAAFGYCSILSQCKTLTPQQTKSHKTSQVLTFS